MIPKLILALVVVFLSHETSSQIVTNTTADEIHFILFTSSGRLSLTNRSISNVQPELNTVVIIHGWLSGLHVDTYLFNLTSAYNDTGNYNVIYVDWSTNSRFDYIWEVYNTISSVGQQVGDLLVLLSNQGVNVRNMHLIGHSLGAHICGYAARNARTQLNGTIYRITGLDPSGPFFSRFYGVIDNPLSLNPRDAEVVDVTHTNTNLFGLNDPIGTVDFYVNGGQNQPFCGDISNPGVLWIAINTCSSTFATRIFLLALNNTSYRASLNAETCDSLVVFGEHISEDARGIYYLRTTSVDPYNTVC